MQQNVWYHGYYLEFSLSQDNQSNATALVPSLLSMIWLFGCKSNLELQIDSIFDKKVRISVTGLLERVSAAVYSLPDL